MTKEEFNNLEVLKQLDYINSLLEKGKSLRSMGEDLEMSKSTFRSRFLKIGYTLNKEKNQYCNDNTVVIQSQSKNIKTPQVHTEPVVAPIKEHNTKALQKYEKDIIELISRKNDILEMLKNYKNNISIDDIPELNINSLPKDLQKNITNKSIKIYNPIYKLFDEICSQYGSFKKQDIISLALLEFYNKYNK